jgi:ribosomal protein S18 acetylase RimI-like enzyme
LFGLKQPEVEEILKQCLNHETNGCELSLSSYNIAEINGKAIASVGAWVEAENGISSASLKGSLLAYVLPQNAFLKFKETGKIIRDLYFETIPGTLQIGVVYVDINYRGLGLAGALINNHIMRVTTRNPDIKEVYIQVFGNNVTAIKAYEKLHFNISKILKTQNIEILKYLPSASKVLMKLSL